MSSTKSILLISHTFPPYPGIGGRRWAKFAKYLSRIGYKVHVISAKNPFEEESLWNEDVLNDPNIQIHALNDIYPSSILVDPHKVTEKLMYRLSLFFLRILSKGTPYDRALFWNRKMLKLSEKLIASESISDIIVSSAPFSSAHSALSLKKKFEKTRLLVDFRDPWTWGKGYGMTSISLRRKHYEEKKEREVVNGCDVLFVPTDEMKCHLDQFYSAPEKTIVLPHGYDPDELQLTKPETSDQIRIILYGTLYGGMGKTFESIASGISSNEKLRLDIYSSSEKYTETFQKSNTFGRTVFFNRPLQPKELFKKFSSYDFVMIVQPDNAADFISTKIYEIIYSGRPIILISQPGKLSDFIIKNELGIHTEAKNFQAIIPQLFALKNKGLSITDFPIENYNYLNLTRRLVGHFI